MIVAELFIVGYGHTLHRICSLLLLPYAGERQYLDDSIKTLLSAYSYTTVSLQLPQKRKMNWCMHTGRQLHLRYARKRKILTIHFMLYCVQNISRRESFDDFATFAALNVLTMTKIWLAYMYIYVCINQMIHMLCLFALHRYAFTKLRLKENWA